MNLLITGAWQEAAEYIPDLELAGHHVVFQKWEKDPLVCDYGWAEGIVCSRLFQYHPIEKFLELRYLQVTSAGTDHLPMEYIQKQKIEFHNARGVYSIPMAEYAVSGVLQLYKRTRVFAENQRLHRWEKQRDIQELFGKTVCIVGCGSVGEECAKRFRAFGCRIIGVRKNVLPNKWFDCISSVRDLQIILPETDILVLAIPLTEETKHLINEVNLQKLKENSVVVNLSRGAVLDTEALVNVLQENTINGAVLDVFEEEPLATESPLWDMEQVILTPHNSYTGEGNRGRLSHLILDNIPRCCCF